MAIENKKIYTIVRLWRMKWKDIIANSYMRIS